MEPTTGQPTAARAPELAADLAAGDVLVAGDPTTTNPLDVAAAHLYGALPPLAAALHALAPLVSAAPGHVADLLDPLTRVATTTGQLLGVLTGAVDAYRNDPAAPALTSTADSTQDPAEQLRGAWHLLAYLAGAAAQLPEGMADSRDRLAALQLAPQP